MKKMSCFTTLCLLLLLAFPVHGYATDHKQRILTDDTGHLIRLPDTVSRVAPCIPSFVQVTLMLAGERITLSATPNPLGGELLERMFPLHTATPYRSTRSLEDLITSGAQVAYGPGTTLSDSQREQLALAGIPFVEINAFRTPEELCDSIERIGMILGGNAEDRARQLTSYYRNNLALAAAQSSTAPKRVRFLSLSFAGNAYTTVNRNDIIQTIVEAAGGENVSADYHSLAKGQSIPVSAEQVILWNPEVILTNSQAGQQAIYQEKAFQNVAAVSTRRVYVCPAGLARWSVRNAEGAMLPLWLGHKLHPELFDEASLSDMVEDFFVRFYRYTPTPEEIAAILEGRNLPASQPKPVSPMM